MNGFRLNRCSEYSFDFVSNTDHMQPENGSPANHSQPRMTDQPVIHPKALNVLVVLEQSDADLTSLVCGLRSHVTLVCTGAQQAAQLIGDFSPDVILVDLRLADAVSFAGRFAASTKAALVALHSPETVSAELCDRPLPFHYRLQRPIMPAELEQFLWQIADKPLRQLDLGGRRSHG